VCRPVVGPGRLVMDGYRAEQGRARPPAPAMIDRATVSSTVAGPKLPITHGKSRLPAGHWLVAVVVWEHVAVCRPIFRHNMLIMVRDRASHPARPGATRLPRAMIDVSGRATVSSTVAGPKLPIMHGKSRLPAGHRLVAIVV
jgi:hypothetical protein